jgi:hypothetical protein
MKPGHRLLRAVCFPFRRSINQRPAGPGGASSRYTARIGINGFRLLGPSIRITMSLPPAKSSSTMNRGMLPKPNPARRKACRAPISASRQTFMSIFRERGIARAAIEQRHAELSFEIRQGLADDGLRPPQLATRCGKAALLGGGDKGAKLIQGHCIEHDLSPKTMDCIE